MTTYTFTPAKGKKGTSDYEPAKGKFTGVYFAYVNLKTPFKKNKATLEHEKEYSLSVVVDKATAKAWKKQFPQNKVREIDTPEFESKMKFAAPFPDQDEQFVLRLSVDSHFTRDTEKNKVGDLIPYHYTVRPKVYTRTDKGVVDITLESDTVGNGSKGELMFVTNENSYGEFPYLRSILVTDKVEYERQERVPTSEWGEVVGIVGDVEEHEASLSGGSSQGETDQETGQEDGAPSAITGEVEQGVEEDPFA